MSNKEEKFRDDDEVEFLYHYPELVMRENYGNETRSYDPDIKYVTAPIDAVGPPGRWIRHRLLESILYGTPVLVAIQQLRNKSFTKFMKFASILGTEEFYALLVCFLIWIIDMRLGRLACIAMGIGFYVANGVKNLLCLPRPPSPPVKPLEDAYYTWGLPSHHSVLGVICPWYIWFYCLLHYHFQPITLVCFFTLICSWSFLVLFCRIYNGVHSPADVVAGGLLGCLIVAFMNRYDSLIDVSSVMNGQNALILPILLAILLVLHPFNEIGIPAFEETTSMTSCAVGFMLGRAFSYGRSTQLKALLETYNPGETSILWLMLAGLLRYIIGGVLVLVTKLTLKLSFEMLFGACLKICNMRYITKSPRHKFYTGYSENFTLPPIYKDKKKNDDSQMDEDEDEEPEKPSVVAKDDEPWNISFHVRFISYMGMGFTAYYCNTLLCQNIGLVL